MRYAFCTGIVVVATAMSVVAAAQSTGMSGGMSGDKMAMDKSYTGCVAKDAKTGAYSLTHVMAADAMAKGSMAGDAMKSDGAMAMKKDAMAEMWLPLMSTNVDLSKHVGHKVTIAGSGAMPMAMAKDAMAMAKPMDKPMENAGAMKGGMKMDMSTFTVKTLTMVSSSCMP
jgi:hypothetical protein